MHPAQPDRLLAAGSGGCWVSNDGGANFTGFGGGLPDVSASDIVIRPDDPDTVYCAIWGSSSGGVWRTTNGGQNWSHLQNGIPFGTNPGRISLAISASNPDILIAGIQEGNGTVYYTADGGDSWVQRNLFGYCSGQCWYDNHVAIDSADPTILYAAGINVWRSLDSGLNWSQASSSSGGRCCNPDYVHVDHHFMLTPSAGVVITASDGGIFHSDDSGSSWDEWSQGMATTQYYGICRREGDAGWAFGGTQDNGSHRYQEGDATPWASVLGGDGGMCMTGPAGSNIIVGEHQNHAMRRSVNNGSSWSSATSGIGGGEPRPWVGLLVADELDRNNMWTATDRIYRSLDARATPWVDVSGALEGAGVSVTAIDVSPQNSNLVAAGYNGGSIYLTTRAILVPFSFGKIDSAELPDRSVRRLRFSPSGGAFLYAVFSGFGSDRIWKLPTFGGTWTNITGDLPNIPVNDLRPDPNHSDSILAATDLGVYRSDDGGISWHSFSTGLPTVAAIEFTYDATFDRLRLGTHGRSMWEWQPSIDSAVAVPDGATIAGTAMQANLLADGSMRVEWDVSNCTARNYNLFWGDLDLVSTRSYSDASCGIGTSGRADMPIPATPSGNLFFLVVGTDEAGIEGPHGFDVFGDAISADGIGLCGITEQAVVSACPQ